MGPEFCCEKFKEERESECIKQDRDFQVFRGSERSVLSNVWTQYCKCTIGVLSILREEIGCCPES